MEVESGMNPNTSPQSVWHMPIGLGAQLIISHVLAAAAASTIARSGEAALALVAAAVAGMALTFTVQRTLWLVNRALMRLKSPRPPAELPSRWHGPLSGLVARINALIAREREVYDLREGLLAQVRDGAAQQERNRLARELHDSIKQQIFSISIAAAAVDARWDADPQGAREALGDVRRSAQEAMVEMNALLQQLSPAPLEKVGLVQALRDQCEALGYRTDADVAIEFGDLPADDHLPAGAQESVFRIAQEAFSNIARHARADHVRLYVGQRDAGGPLVLEIQDDGQGFAEGQAEAGMGLGNIRHRVLALAGELAIESGPGKGTALHVTIPLAEPVDFREDAMEGRDHTLNKVFLVGLGGGLASIAALFYPLYVLVPGRYVSGWPPGWGIVGLALEVVAAGLAIATGYLAARWARVSTRQAGTLLGALAGGVAGAVLFFGIGGPAATVAGGAALLERELIPAAGRADVIRLLAGSAVGIVWWSHGTFWAAVLAGTGLGAIGGLLAPPTSQPARGTDLRLAGRTILTAATIVSALTLLTAVTRFALLEPTIRDGLAVNGVSPGTTLPLERVSDWLIGTPFLIYVIGLVATYFPLRAEIKQVQSPARLGAARATAALLAFVSLGVPVCLGAIGSPVLPNGVTVQPRGWLDVTGLPHPSPASAGAAIGAPLLIPGLAISLVMGGLYLAAMNAAYRRQRALGLSSAHPVVTLALISTLLSLGAIDWALGLTLRLSLLAGVAIVAISVLLIVNLFRQPKRSPSAPAHVVAVISILLSPAIIGRAVHLPPFWGVLVGLTMVVADVVLILSLFRLSKQPSSDTITQAQLRLAISQSVSAGLGSIIAIVIPPMTAISTVVGTGLITNRLVEVLVGYAYAAQEFTLIELVRDVYLAQARAFLITFVAAAVLVGLLTLLASGIVAVPQQLSDQSKVAT